MGGPIFSPSAAVVFGKVQVIVGAAAAELLEGVVPPPEQLGVPPVVIKL